MNIHVVKAGETASAIADEYHIPLKLLLSQNGLKVGEDLVQGQALLILKPALIHTVAPGDTLCRIARQHHISLRQLYRNNPV